MRPGNRHRVPAILLGFKWKIRIILGLPWIVRVEIQLSTKGGNSYSPIERRPGDAR